MPRHNCKTGSRTGMCCRVFWTNRDPHYDLNRRKIGCNFIVGLEMGLMRGPMGKTLEELHTEAIAKLRTLLYGGGKLTPEAYRFIGSSEKIIGPIQAKLVGSRPSFGGLEYRVEHPSICEIQISHIEGRRFQVSSSRKHLSTMITAFVISCDFKDVPRTIFRHYELVENCESGL